jgi:S-(hydroxymethyl)glutathione dehydrogenase/alcohol dehydrogenase
MRVAVAYEPDGPLVLEDLPVPAIGPRDVLVRVAASGICRTDLTAVRDPGRRAPLVAGHEACGTVEDVGPDVERVRVGERVVVSVTPACGRCYWCVHDMSQHCERKALRFVARFDLPDGRKAPALCGCGSFAEAMVVDEAAVVAAHTDLPDEQLALLGCGVMTGLGAAFNIAKVRPGASVAVIGCGGVGQSVVQGARIAGASTIIAIDPSAGRRQASLGVGATHTLDPSASNGASDGDSAIDLVEQVRALTEGRGVDHAFEVVGQPQLAVQAFDMARLEGTVTIVGMPRAADAVLSLPAAAVMRHGKHIQGCVAGGTQILRDVPRYIRLAETGQLDLGAMVSQRITLDQVNAGITLLERADGVRTVIVS